MTRFVPVFLSVVLSATASTNALCDTDLDEQIRIVNGVVTIQGTSQNDVAKVVRKSDKLYVAIEYGDKRVERTFAYKSVRRIVFHGKAGNDRFQNLTDISCSAFGDTGNDFLQGGSNDDTIRGGSGNDMLIAGKGKNRLSGGSGDDKFVADRNNDRIDGGTGNDTINGAVLRDARNRTGGGFF